jgi:hypothetical protein
MKTKIIFSSAMILALSVTTTSFGQRPVPGQPIGGAVGNAPNVSAAALKWDKALRSITLGEGQVVNVKLVSQQKANTWNVIRKIAQQAMCLNVEEITGTRYEDKIIVDNPVDVAANLLPGMIIDASKLINEGKIVPLHMNNRKPTTLSISASARNNVLPVNAQNPQFFQERLREATNRLKSPENFFGPPNIQAQTFVYESTSEKSMQLQVGASVMLPMGAVSASFGMNSNTKTYKYMLRFEQACFVISARSFDKPEDVLIDANQLIGDELGISEVTYGRVLNLLIESTVDLSKTSFAIDGKVNWGAVSASLQSDFQSSSLSSQVTITTYTAGMQPFVVSNISDLPKRIDDYFANQFQNGNIYEAVPISYKLSDLNNKSVYLEATANVRDRGCVATNKARISLKSIELIDANNDSRKIYGAVGIRLFLNNTPINLNGQPFPNSQPSNMTEFRINVADKDRPITVTSASPKVFEPSENANFGFIFNDLNLRIQINPSISRQRNNAGDLTYSSASNFNRTIRASLTNATTEHRFILTADDNSRLAVTIELELLPN